MSASISTPWSAQGHHAEALVRMLESAVDVRRRYQFFVWTQSNLQALVPHQLAVCGAYHRVRKQLQFEVFNSVAVPDDVTQTLTDTDSPFMQQLMALWSCNRGKPLALNLADVEGLSSEPARQAIQDAGYTELLVHGVSRPQRPTEIESLFIFGTVGSSVTVAQMGALDLLMPHLHATYQRVRAVEREISDLPPAQTAAGAAAQAARTPITDREKQILCWVREGLSNQEIGSELGISALTVKNHVQKILRKLGASNRAQAVARAMTMNLLGRVSDDDAISRRSLLAAAG